MATELRSHLEYVRHKVICESVCISKQWNFAIHKIVYPQIEQAGNARYMFSYPRVRYSDELYEFKIKHC